MEAGMVLVYSAAQSILNTNTGTQSRTKIMWGNAKRERGQEWASPNDSPTSWSPFQREVDWRSLVGSAHNSLLRWLIRCQTLSECPLDLERCSHRLPPSLIYLTPAQRLHKTTDHERKAAASIFMYVVSHVHVVGTPPKSVATTYQMESCKPSVDKIVFLCKGSRGDVHPLLSIALAFKWEEWVLNDSCFSHIVMSCCCMKFDMIIIASMRWKSQSNVSGESVLMLKLFWSVHHPPLEDWRRSFQGKVWMLSNYPSKKFPAWMTLT